jgi:hypothetical protein
MASRPVHEREHLVRDAMLAIKKAVAEGTPSELLIVLGWLINTRRMLMSLPDNKHVAWTQDITTMLAQSAANKRIRYDDLKKLLR